MAQEVGDARCRSCIWDSLPAPISRRCPLFITSGRLRAFARASANALVRANFRGCAGYYWRGWPADIGAVARTRPVDSHPRVAQQRSGRHGIEKLFHTYIQTAANACPILANWSPFSGGKRKGCFYITYHKRPPLHSGCIPSLQVPPVVQADLGRRSGIPVARQTD